MGEPQIGDLVNLKKNGETVHIMGYALLTILLAVAGWTMKTAQDLLVDAARLQAQVLQLQKEAVEATQARKDIRRRLDDAGN